MTPRARTTVVSGSKSGMGRAVRNLLEARGERVIGVDLGEADVVADLGAAEGREAALTAIAAASPDGIDAILPFDAELVELCLAGDELRALGRADHVAEAYASSKRALTRWIRRTAAAPGWAPAGVLLNGVAPGLVRTPMTEPLLATDEGRAMLAASAPFAVREAASADDVAPLLAFLASPDNRYMVGQVPFCDGGKDVLLRGERVL
jgi:NAD(P)-dependent dehydrogenase (short-subunit alcohol dehydrogenase family)